MDSNEFLISVIKKLVQVENNKMLMSKISIELINLINSQFYDKDNYNTIKDLTELIRKLTTPLEQWGINFEYLEDNLKNKSIVNYSGSIRNEFIDFFNREQTIENYQQKNMLSFLLMCRKKAVNNLESLVQEIYTNARSFLNHTNVYLDPLVLEDFLEINIDDKELAEIFRGFFTAIISIPDDFYVCPVCGDKISFEFQKERKCRNIICERLNMDKSPIKKRKGKYVVMKEGIKRYTLLPGITELSIYNTLKERYNLEVSLYPHIDKYDITVSSGEKVLNIDIKDHKNPEGLVETIIDKQGIDKFVEGNVILVIPNYRKELENDYRERVKASLKRKNINLSVMYERQLYKHIEEYFGGESIDNNR